MLFYLTSRIVSSVAAFLYPGYASYKTLSQRPASEEELERWLMYWSVLGCIVGVEYVAEWVVSWIPFYYTMKTVFLLYLALPQTRGSSYIYINHLQPFFNAHETQIDATLASLKAKVYSFLQARLRALWDQIAASVGQQQQAAFNPTAAPIDQSVPPTLHDPASGPVQLVSALWRSYGPGIIASGTALLRQTAVGATPSTTQTALNTPPASAPPSYIRQDVTQSVLERRRQLEAELAALSRESPETNPAATPAIIPTASPLLSLSPTSSESDLHHRERVASGSGKFEEIEVPSDVEGYDVRGKKEGGGYEAGQKRGSWFGWGSSTSKGGYESLKNE